MSAQLVSKAKLSRIKRSWLFCRREFLLTQTLLKSFFLSLTHPPGFLPLLSRDSSSVSQAYFCKQNLIKLSSRGITHFTSAFDFLRYKGPLRKNRSKLSPLCLLFRAAKKLGSETLSLSYALL